MTKEIAKVDLPEGGGLQKAVIKKGVLTITTGQAGADDIASAMAVDNEALQGMLAVELIRVLAPVGSEDVTNPLKVAVEGLRAIGPQSPAEAMLAAQMVAAHHAAMSMLARAKATDRVDFMDRYANMATKFSRTYLAQLEGLAKLRRGGKQVVEHVHVNSGGQAVIANSVTTGGRGADGKSGE